MYVHCFVDPIEPEMAQYTMTCTIPFTGCSSASSNPLQCRDSRNVTPFQQQLGATSKRGEGIEEEDRRVESKLSTLHA